MTTATPIRVTADDAPVTRASEEHMDYLVTGLIEATQWPEAVRLAGLPVDSQHPAVFAWEALCAEVAAELAPQVAELLDAAIRRRLPWTWEPER
jgi:hypothetical protein